MAALAAALVLAALVVVPTASVSAASLPPTQVTVGSQHTCSLAPSGPAYCWGLNGNGQLGDGTTTDRSLPVPVQQSGLNFTSITAGGAHTCALTASGQGYCWGYNGNGRLGDGTTTTHLTPTAVSQTGITFTALAAGGFSTCGLATTGTAYCWGAGGNGQIGNGATGDVAIPTAVSQSTLVFSSLAMGATTACALTAAGAAYCWGSNGSGQLGNNDTTLTQQPSPVAVQQGALAFTSIVGGGAFTCALTSGGLAYCWGRNNYGQLADSTNFQRYVPTAVQQGGTTFTSLTAGSYQACAVSSSGAPYCWGYNNYGQVGDGTNTSRNVPVAVNGSLNLSSVASSGGAYQTCGVKASSQLLVCWGHRLNGALGDNVAPVRELNPVSVRSSQVFTAVVTGTNHACGLTSSGQAYCWGSNASYQLGDSTINDHYGPTPVQQGVLTFVSLAAGANHTCGLTSGGQAYCWGYNASGQLGDNTTTNRTAPVMVQQSGVVFISIVAGSSHTCGVNSSGQVYCWGANGAGQLGDNTIVNKSVPTAVQQGAVTFSSITAGVVHTCGLTSGGAAYCWGHNGNGELGNNSSISVSTPVAVQQGAVSYTSISAGANDTCALSGAGQVYCWGLNGNGQLGDNTVTTRLTPVAAQQGGVVFVSITPGAYANCARTVAGAAYCWGLNASGQLGDGTLVERHLPVAVGATNSFSAIVSSEGSSFTCGLTSLGTTFCWGYDSYGQLGDGPGDALTPVQAWYDVTVAGADASVTIDPSFTFTVAGSGSSCNGFTPNVTAGAGAVPLGHIGVGVQSIGTQLLSVATNAGGGFVVTLHSVSTTSPVLVGTGSHSIADVGVGPAPSATTAGFGFATGDVGVAMTSGNLAPVPNNSGSTNVMTAASVATRSSCVAYLASASAATPADTYASAMVYTAIPTF